VKRKSVPPDGLKNLIMIYRKAFKIPENIYHYSEQDFKNAERQFVKYMLYTRALSDASPQRPSPP
jgi:hypothetical protein